MKKNDKELLIKGMELLDIPIKDDLINKFIIYLELYKEWNNNINISSIKDNEDIIKKHFLDSIAPIKIIEKYINKFTKIIDLGSGGGFPAIPLKLIKPQWKIFIAEINKKKISFLKNVISNLNINIEIIDSSQNKILPNFDIVISRAFGKFDKNIDEALKYLKKNGWIILYKATIEKINLELDNTKWKNKFDFQIIPIQVPLLEAERNVLIIKK